MKSPEQKTGRFFGVLDKAVNAALSSLLAVIVGVMLIAVFYRYVLGSSLTWTGEFVRYLFVWLTLLGASVVFRDRGHIRIDYFIDLCPPAVRRVMDVLVLCVVTLFFGATLVLGILWVNEMKGSLTPALGWPLNWFFYAALPVSSLLGVVFAFRRFLDRTDDAQADGGHDEQTHTTGSAL